MGRRTKAGTRNKVNRALARACFMVLGEYPRCQNCGANGVTNAHSKKGFDPLTNERWLPDDPDHPNFGNWFKVAWLCINCHTKIEADHGAMEKVVLAHYEATNRRWIEEARHEFGL